MVTKIDHMEISTHLVCATGHLQYSLPFLVLRENYTYANDTKNDTVNNKRTMNNMT